jgi:hypothetical protein
VVDRVYREMDRPDANDGRPLPGVAPEFWPEPAPGGARLWDPAEAYGWGANALVYLLRYLIGFVEGEDVAQHAFALRPALPAALRTPGARYAVRNLSIRGAHFDLTYGVLSATEVQIGVRRREAGTVTVAGQGSATLAFEFAGRGEETYQVTLD